MNWSQSQLAKKSGVSREMIGRDERGKAILSIEVAKKIADACGGSLDFLLDEGFIAAFDKKTLQRIQEIQSLDQDTKGCCTMSLTPTCEMPRPGGLNKARPSLTGAFFCFFYPWRFNRPSR
jgi:transcriptional regulator with XRE-family HTH domain